MRKHLLFIFIFSMFLVSVTGQVYNSLPQDNAVPDSPTTINPSFSLSEAYPNPADSETKLDYRLSDEIRGAKIIVRSLLGLIVNEQLIEENAGTVTIQTNSFTAGLYFYSLLLNDDIVVTRKLIVRH